MPQYYFDSDDGEVIHTDGLGTSHDGDEAARFASLTSLSDLAREYLPSWGAARTMTVALRRADGRMLLHLALTLTSDFDAPSGDNQN